MRDLDEWRGFHGVEHRENHHCHWARQQADWYEGQMKLSVRAESCTVSSSDDGVVDCLMRNHSAVDGCRKMHQFELTSCWRMNQSERVDCWRMIQSELVGCRKMNLFPSVGHWRMNQSGPIDGSRLNLAGWIYH